MPPLSASAQALQEHRETLQDQKEGMFRTAVVPACYSVEEFLMGVVPPLPEVRLKNIRLTEKEIGYGVDACAALGKKLLDAFKKDPRLFCEVFGFPLAGLRSDGLSVNRPWHSEVISVTAFSDKFKLLNNVLVTEALTKQDQKRPVRYEGNVLLLFSGLDPKVDTTLGGFRTTPATQFLSQRLEPLRPELDQKAASIAPGVTLDKQFGWLATLPDAVTDANGRLGKPAAPLGRVLMSHKAARCTLPYRHSFERCLRYHVLQPRSGQAVFDVRRPPCDKAGALTYSSELCTDNGPHAAGSASMHWFACRQGAACKAAHSGLEVQYHPQQFKRSGCDALQPGGHCTLVEAGAPAQLCHHAHSALEQTQVLSQIQLLFPKQPELLARHEELPPITEPAAVPSSTPAAAQPAAVTATAAAVSRSSKASSSSSSSRTTVAVMNVGGRLLPVPAAGLSQAAAESAFPALPGTSKPANGAAAKQAVQATGGSKVWGAGQASATTAPAAGAEAAASSSAGSPVSANGGSGESKQQEDAGAQGAVSDELWSFLFLGPEGGDAVALQLRWWYVDPSDNMQGPFAAEDLLWWCKEGMLPLDCRVCPCTPADPAPTDVSVFWQLGSLVEHAAGRMREFMAAKAAEPSAAPPEAAAPAASAAATSQPTDAPEAAAAGLQFGTLAPLSTSSAEPEQLAVPVAVPIPQPVPVHVSAAEQPQLAHANGASAFLARPTADSASSTQQLAGGIRVHNDSTGTPTAVAAATQQQQQQQQQRPPGPLIPVPTPVLQSQRPPQAPAMLLHELQSRAQQLRRPPSQQQLEQLQDAGAAAHAGDASAAAPRSRRTSSFGSVSSEVAAAPDAGRDGVSTAMATHAAHAREQPPSSSRGPIQSAGAAQGLPSTSTGGMAAVGTSTASGAIQTAPPTNVTQSSSYTPSLSSTPVTGPSRTPGPAPAASDAAQPSSSGAQSAATSRSHSPAAAAPPTAATAAAGRPGHAPAARAATPLDWEEGAASETEPAKGEETTAAAAAGQAAGLVAPAAAPPSADNDWANMLAGSASARDTLKAPTTAQVSAAGTSTPAASEPTSQEVAQDDWMVVQQKKHKAKAPVASASATPPPLPVPDLPKLAPGSAFVHVTVHGGADAAPSWRTQPGASTLAAAQLREQSKVASPLSPAAPAWQPPSATARAPSTLGSSSGHGTASLSAAAPSYQPPGMRAAAAAGTGSLSPSAPAWQPPKPPQPARPSLLGLSPAAAAYQPPGLRSGVGLSPAAPTFQPPGASAAAEPAATASELPKLSPASAPWKPPVPKAAAGVQAEPAAQPGVRTEEQPASMDGKQGQDQGPQPQTAADVQTTAVVGTAEAASQKQQLQQQEEMEEQEEQQQEYDRSGSSPGSDAEGEESTMRDVPVDNIFDLLSGVGEVLPSPKRPSPPKHGRISTADGDGAATEPSARQAAAASTSAASAAPAAARVHVSVYDMGGPKPNVATKVLDKVFGAGASLGELLSWLRVEHHVEHPQVLWRQAASPWPRLRLLEAAEQKLGELLAQQEGGSEGGAVLDLEVYHRTKVLIPPSKPLLEQLAVLVPGFWANLMALVYPLDASTCLSLASNRVVQDVRVTWLKRHVYKAFEAAMSQGVLYNHQHQWCAFNTGLPSLSDRHHRDVLVFLQRRDWQQLGTIVPWVATKKIASREQAEEWMGTGKLPGRPTMEVMDGPGAPPAPLPSAATSHSSSSLGSSAFGRPQAPVPLPSASWKRNSAGAYQPPVPSTSSAASGSAFGPSAVSAFFAAAPAPVAGSTAIASAGSAPYSFQQQMGKQWAPLGAVPTENIFPSYAPLRVLPNAASMPHAASLPAGIAVSKGEGANGVQEEHQDGQARREQQQSDEEVQQEQEQQRGDAAGTAAPGTSSRPSSSGTVHMDLTADAPPDVRRLVLSCSIGDQPLLRRLLTAREPSAAVDAGPCCQVTVCDTTAPEQVVSALEGWLMQLGDHMLPLEQGCGAKWWEGELLLGFEQLGEPSEADVQLADTTQDADGQVGVVSGTAGNSSDSRADEAANDDTPETAGQQQQDVDSTVSKTAGNCSSEDHNSSAVEPSVVWRLLEAGATCDLSPAPSVGQQLQLGSLPEGGPVPRLDVQVFFTSARRYMDCTALFAATYCRQSMWSELAAAAEPEWWGNATGMSSATTHLQHYIGAAFRRAAQQGRLALRHTPVQQQQGSGSNSGAVAGSSAADGVADGAGADTTAGYERVLLFNTGLLTPGLQSLYLEFRANTLRGTDASSSNSSSAVIPAGSASSGPWSPWVFRAVRTHHQVCALDPPAAPTPPQLPPFDPTLPIQFDMDAAMASESVRASLRRHLTCRGVALPEPVWDTMVAGGVAATTASVARCSGMPLPQAWGNGRLQWVLPLLVVRGEAPSLVLVLEQFGRPGGRRLYAGRLLLAFETVYGGLRAMGKVDWVSWVHQALVAQQAAPASSAAVWRSGSQQQPSSQYMPGTGNGVVAARAASSGAPCSVAPAPQPAEEQQKQAVEQEQEHEPVQAGDASEQQQQQQQAAAAGWNPV